MQFASNKLTFLCRPPVTQKAKEISEGRLRSDSHWASCVAQIGEFFPKANALCTREELSYLLTSHHSLCSSDCAVRMPQTSTLHPGSWKPPLDGCAHVSLTHLRGGNPN